MSTPTPQALSLAMAMIDRRAWRLPGQTIDMVRALTIDAPDLPEDHYREIGSRQAAEILYGDPKDRRNAERALKFLVDHRIVETVPGSGTRPTAYRINGNFDEWVDVPWRPSRGVALTRLGSFAVVLGTAQNPSSAVALMTALASVAPLSLRRRKDVLAPSQVRRHKVRPSAVTWTTAQAPAQDERHLFLESSYELSFSDQEKKRFQMLKEAVLRRHSGRADAYLAGAPRRQLAEMARSLDDDRCSALVSELARNGPKELPVPQLVQWLDDWTPAAAPDPALAHAAERRRLATERGMLLDQLEHELDPDFALQLRNELADVDAGLARLDRKDLDGENDLVGEA